MKSLELTETYYISLRGLATVLGISPERVRQLEDEGNLPAGIREGQKKYFELWPALKMYVDYKCRDEVDLIDDADLRYKNAKADKMELELSEFKGQMHRAEDIELVMGNLVSYVRSALMALPGRLAVDVAKENNAKKCETLIKNEAANILTLLRNYQYDSAAFESLVREREKWMRSQGNMENDEEEIPPRRRRKTTAKSAVKKDM